MVVRPTRQVGSSVRHAKTLSSSSLSGRQTDETGTVVCAARKNIVEQLVVIIIDIVVI